MNAIEKLYEHCETSVKHYNTDEEAIQDFGGNMVELFQAVLDEHVAQGTDIENEYHAIERQRPLTVEENTEANARLLPIRREVIRAGEALRAARKFKEISTGSVN